MRSAPTATEVEAVLTPEQRKKVDGYLKRLASQQGNKCKKVWSEAAECSICSRAKHSCKWQVKGNSVVTGSWCYCCGRAALKLSLTKNLNVLLACPDVLSVLQKRSQQISTEISEYGGDFCSCRSCKDKPS